MDFSKTFSNYYNLAKPGIIYGNLLTALAGYLFASQWHNDYRTLLAMLVGLALIIGCGCVINNVIDRNLDKAMERTKKRAIVAGDISVRSAVIYGLILGILGSVILLKYTNKLTFFVALFGLISYLVFYGVAKRKTVYGTMVGSLPGAVPPLVGYCSVTDHIDVAGLLIVMILICWQLSHFYAIALYRKADYKKAKIPVWPVVKGDKSTELQIFGFMVLFCLFGISLIVLGYCGFTYLAIILGISLWWFISALRTKDKLPTKDWGRKVFLHSLTIIMLTSVALAIGPIAP